MSSEYLNYSINQFIKSANISRAHLYTLWKQGLGPKFFRLGRRRLISHQAAIEWITKMEQSHEDQ